MKVWVLLKTPLDGQASVMGVYPTREALAGRVERIAQRNSQYQLRATSETSWRIGPDEDEGFFGNKPVYLSAHETTLPEQEQSDG